MFRRYFAYHIPVGAGIDHGVDDEGGAGNGVHKSESDDRSYDVILGADGSAGSRRR